MLPVMKLRGTNKDLDDFWFGLVDNATDPDVDYCWMETERQPTTQDVLNDFMKLLETEFDDNSIVNVTITFDNLQGCAPATADKLVELIKVDLTKYPKIEWVNRPSQPNRPSQ